MLGNSSSLPLVSVVTPAYNEEQYLRQCIESVLSQTYTHWDYLIVNNCSTDRTLEIAQSYASRDPRIRVVTNQNHVHAVPNFNIALRGISPESKYCKVLLADDWMFPECMERMVALMEDHPSVGVTGAYGQQGQWVIWQGIPLNEPVVSGRDICRSRLLGGMYVFGSPSSLMYRADLIRARSSFYNENNPHAADSEACFEVLKDCDFGFVHQVLTFSRLREGSLLAASKQINSAAADTLRELITFGPVYLTQDEYEATLAALVRRYYGFLASQLPRRRGKEFWAHHKKTLRESGVGFSNLALLAAVGRKVSRRFRFHEQGREQWGL